MGRTNRFFFPCLVALVSGALGLAFACTSATSAPTGVDGGVDAGPATSEDTGAPSEDAGPPQEASAPACTNDPGCAQSGQSCSGNSVVSCTFGAGGCLVAKTTPCASSETCQTSGTIASCACPATSPCSVDGTMCQGSETSIACTVDSFGCFVATVTACIGLQSCNATSGTCECPTPECAKPGTSCASSTSILTCSETDAGCFIQPLARPCPGAETCQGTSPNATCAPFAVDAGDDAAADASDDGG